MEPVAAPPDPMNEMYEFFAFGDALDDGFSPDDLIEQQAAEGRAHVAVRANEFVQQLINLINVNEGEREELVVEARGLAPRAAQEYCGQLSQRVDELKQTVTQQERAFANAEKDVREQNVQNGRLVASISQLKNGIQRNKDNNFRFQGQVYAGGRELCQKTGDPNYKPRSGNDSRKY